MRRRSAVLAALAALALLAGGCRSSQPERATAAVHGFLDALAAGDGAAACDHLAESGVSELLLLALEHDVSAEEALRRGPDACAVIAEQLPVREAATALRRAAVSDVLLHGSKATVVTDGGAFEAEEREGSWRVARFEPLAAGGDLSPPARAATLAVVSPHFSRPALGAALAHETPDAAIEVTGVMRPPGARFSAEPLAGGQIERAQGADGRFRVELALRPGVNTFLLRAEAPGHEPAEATLRVHRR